MLESSQRLATWKPSQIAQQNASETKIENADTVESEAERPPYWQKIPRWSRIPEEQFKSYSWQVGFKIRQCPSNSD
jgi:hypothetical protein